ncbi:hypothetical protein CAPTEDRAFT_211141, partial [Capitella teleta]
SLPLAMNYARIPRILDRDSEETEDSEESENIGSVAAKYLRKFATKDADKTYGIYDKNGQFYIGDTRIGVIDENIIVGEKEYKGTPGLWELVVMKAPKDGDYTQDDYNNYAEILIYQRIEKGKE